MQATTVSYVMATGVVAVPEAAGYKDLVTVIRRSGVSAVPVLDAARRVVGWFPKQICCASWPTRRFPRERSGWRGGCGGGRRPPG